MALLPSDCQARDSSGLMPRDLVLVPISSWLTCSLPWFPWCNMEGQALRPLMVLRHYCSRDFSHPSYPCLNFLHWALDQRWVCVYLRGTGKGKELGIKTYKMDQCGVAKE